MLSQTWYWWQVFQSTSVITDGRSMHQAGLTIHQARFNPRPSSLTDEACQNRRAIGDGFRFNPRPSSLTDEAALFTHGCGFVGVSIHVRHH